MWKRSEQKKRQVSQILTIILGESTTISFICILLIVNVIAWKIGEIVVVGVVQ